jgi:transcription-repair coupling factor (superfamily II helicase)
LIIDEEQKFGVAVKEKLKQLKVNVDTLTLTATPIPRTLQFSLMGARDLSIIQTPPQIVILSSQKCMALMNPLFVRQFFMRLIVGTGLFHSQQGAKYF